MSWKDVDVWEPPLDDYVKRERPPEPRLVEPSPDDELLDRHIKVFAEQLVVNMEVRR